jgi:hypothetical protein
MPTLANQKTISINKTIAQYVISNISVILDTSATINVVLQDENGGFLSNQSFVLAHPDYNNWSTNDSYITSFVEAQIANLTTL